MVCEPSQDGLILPSWWNLRQKKSGHCHSLHEPKITKQHQKYSSSLQCVHLTNFSCNHSSWDRWMWCAWPGCTARFCSCRSTGRPSWTTRRSPAHTRRQHHTDLGYGVAQVVARRLAVRQVRVRISVLHPRGCNEDNKSGTLRVVYTNIVCLLD